jgi:hypothetical protein
MSKNSILGLLTHDDLVAAFGTKAVKYALNEFCKGNFNEEQVAVELVKNLELTAPDFSKVNIFYEGKKARGKVSKVKEVLSHYGEVNIKDLERLRFAFEECLVVYFDRPRKFIVRISLTERNNMLHQLVGLYKRLEEAFAQVQDSPVIGSKQVFYEKFFKYASRLVSKARAASPNTFNTDIIYEALQLLSVEDVVYNDPHKELTIYKIKYFMAKTSRVNMEYFMDPEVYVKFMDSNKMLDQAITKVSFFDQDIIRQKKIAKGWVDAQLYCYDQDTDAINIVRQIGYMRGPRSIDRYKRYLGRDKSETKKENKLVDKSGGVF